MIVEYIRYAIPHERHEDFERAYAEGSTSLEESPNCLGYEMTHGVEEPANYVVRIEWDSMPGHLEGFRRGPHFAAFFAAVRPFFDDIEEMRHYQRTAVVGGVLAR